jgi:hypothetical protein
MNGEFFNLWRYDKMATCIFCGEEVKDYFHLNNHIKNSQKCLNMFMLLKMQIAFLIRKTTLLYVTDVVFLTMPNDGFVGFMTSENQNKVVAVKYIHKDSELSPFAMMMSLTGLMEDFSMDSLFIKPIGFRKYFARANISKGLMITGFEVSASSLSVLYEPWISGIDYRDNLDKILLEDTGIEMVAQHPPGKLSDRTIELIRRWK